MLTEGILLKDRYKIDSLIKSGGMGSIYKASDIRLNCICAVKELIPSYGDTENVEWFEREAKILASLSHQGLPKVSDYFTCNGMYYLVMDFIEGEDLLTVLEKEGNPGLSEEKVITWTEEILKILDYLHSRNPPVLYRDMKPANIMLNKEGRIFLIDFGIAKVFDNIQTQTVIGTEGYAPPEQFHGHAEIRSDLYSLGATAHHLLSGIEPVPFKFEDILSVSSGFRRIIMKSLSYKAEERFTSARRMLKELTLIKKDRNSAEHNTSSVRGTWKTQFADTEALLRNIHFLDENCGWAVGYGGFFDGVILNTVNGGKSWTVKKTAGLSDIYFVSPSEGWAVGGGLTGGIILYTADGGKTWKKKKAGLFVPVLNKVYFINFTTGWIAGDKGFILHTKDGGNTWEKQKSNTSMELYSIHFVNNNTGWIAGQGGLILHTKDGGEKWIKQESRTSAFMRSVYFIDELHGFITGDRGTLLCTEDGGHKWEKKEINFSLNLNAITFIDKYGFIAGEKGTVLQSGDRGETWEKIPAITSSNLFGIYFLDNKKGFVAGEKGTVLKYGD